MTTVPRILHRLPYHGRPVTVRDSDIAVGRHQIVVWVSLAHPRAERWTLDCPRIPAILDTGHTHTLMATRTQMSSWARLPFSDLPRVSSVRFRQRPVAGPVGEQLERERFPTFGVRLWLHHNQPGERDEWLDREPYPLEIGPAGMIVCPDQAAVAPRLPVFGLRLLDENRLRLCIDGRAREVRLHTGGFWPFA
jgi:hypothetical protein